MQDALGQGLHFTDGKLQLRRLRPFVHCDLAKKRQSPSEPRQSTARLSSTSPSAPILALSLCFSRLLGYCPTDESLQTLIPRKTVSVHIHQPLYAISDRTL